VLDYFRLSIEVITSILFELCNVKAFGDIEYVRILKDKSSGQPKGLAYVKYFKASHAAMAFENCDPR
jgi:hypothetical protein